MLSALTVTSFISITTSPHTPLGGRSLSTPILPITSITMQRLLPASRSFSSSCIKQTLTRRNRCRSLSIRPSTRSIQSRWLSILQSPTPPTIPSASPTPLRYLHIPRIVHPRHPQPSPPSSPLTSPYLLATLLALGLTVSYHTSPTSSQSSSTRLYKWGNGNPTPQLLSPLTNITAVAAGGHQSLFLTSSNLLFSCHRDDGSIPRLIPLPPSVTIASIACSDSHSAFVTTDGTAYLWSRPHKSSPYPLIPTPISLPNVKQVACGRYHTLFLTTDGAVYGLGKCNDGALGIGPPPPDVTRALHPIPLSLTSFPSPVQSIAAGTSFSLFLTADGRVYGTGDNANGQLALPLSSPRFIFTPIPLYHSAPVVGVWAGEQTTALLDAGGRLLMAGKGDEGQLGGGPDSRVVVSNGLREVEMNERRVRGCDLGFAHSGAVVEGEGGRGEVLLWGRGREGQLGRGDKGGSVASGVDVPKRVTALGNVDVVQIALGTEHTLALVREG